MRWLNDNVNYSDTLLRQFGMLMVVSVLQQVFSLQYILHLGGCTPLSRYATKTTYQSERPEDSESFDVWKAEFNETQQYDDDVETTPFVLQILVQAERDYLERRFRREYARKHLEI